MSILVESGNLLHQLTCQHLHHHYLKCLALELVVCVLLHQSQQPRLLHLEKHIVYREEKELMSRGWESMQDGRRSKGHH